MIFGGLRLIQGDEKLVCPDDSGPEFGVVDHGKDFCVRLRRVIGPSCLEQRMAEQAFHNLFPQALELQDRRVRLGIEGNGFVDRLEPPGAS